MSENIHHLSGNLLVGSSHFFVDTTNNRVGITTTNPDAGLHVNSNAYVHTDFRVGSGIAMNVTGGRITAGSFEGDGSLLENVPGDSGSWVKGSSSNIHLAVSTDNVGIGVLDAGHKLEVSGTFRASSYVSTPYLYRSSHNSGYMVGSYNSVGGNGAKVNPIYVIGSSYMPSTEDALGSMYGMGFSSESFNSILTGWGLYLAANGTARIGLDADNGRIKCTGYVDTPYLHRSSHNSGYMVGSYNSVGANSAKVNPIYVIGSSYKPTGDGSLGSMYGIGYSHANFTSILSSNEGAGWGMYVAADGDARIGLNGSTGSIKMRSQENGDSYAWEPGNDGWMRLQGNSPGQGNMYGSYTSLAVGRFHAAGTTHYSDDRLKHFEEEIPNALELIQQLKPYKYKKTSKIYTEDYTGEIGEDWEWEIGLIAQDIEKIPYLEFAVSKPEDSPEKDKYGLNYTQFIGVCIQGIKKLDEELQTTRIELAETKTDLEERLNTHTHPLEPHTHPLEEHTHPLEPHTHPLEPHTHPLEEHTHPLEPHTHPLEEHTHPDLVDQLTIEKAKTRELQQRLTLIEHSHAALVSRLVALENM